MRMEINQLDMYTSPLCGPCQALKPLLEALAPGYGVTINYIDVSSEKGSMEASDLGIRGVPTLVSRGDILHVGGMSITEVNEMLKDLCDEREL